ncbi:hypothetical protein [Actinospongicola halichondriae]|uniref:hypothetical protein n=1 Tax=Actinospongicola halichondriae TaxID=3236844 RepID=UPI003D5CA379
MRLHRGSNRSRARIAAAGVALVLAASACGSSDDDAAPAGGDQATETGGSDVGDGAESSDPEGNPESDSTESPYEVDAVAPVDQGVATLTIDGSTYEFLDVGDPDDERDGYCRHGEFADQLEAIMKNVDAAGDPVPEVGAEGFFNTLFVTLPFNATFTPELEFQIDGGAWTTKLPERASEVEWGFSPDGNHAEGTATFVDRDDDSVIIEGTFTVTCPVS